MFYLPFDALNLIIVVDVFLFIRWRYSLYITRIAAKYFDNPSAQQRERKGTMKFMGELCYVLLLTFSSIFICCMKRLQPSFDDVCLMIHSQSIKLRLAHNNCITFADEASRGLLSSSSRHFNSALIGRGKRINACDVFALSKHLFILN